VLAVQRRDATGIDILRGLTVLRIGSGAGQSTLTTKSELVDVLHECFDFDPVAIGDDALEALWTNVHRAHLKWQAARRLEPTAREEQELS